MTRQSFKAMCRKIDPGCIGAWEPALPNPDRRPYLLPPLKYVIRDGDGAVLVDGIPGCSYQYGWELAHHVLYARKKGN